MIIIIDGLCNLCEFSVQFIIKRDKRKKFKFVQAQSQFGEKIMAKHGINAIEANTLVLIKNDLPLFRSDAVMEIIKRLDGIWKIFYVFKIIPTIIRDPIYNFIAKKRYRWFGKRDKCFIINTEIGDRFL